MNVFDLFASLSLDSSAYNQGLDDAESRANSVGSVIGRGLGVAAAATGAALGAAAAGVATLTTQSVQAYANFEQLTGGVEKIFEDSADTVMEYANQAFETSGLSANQYMETVTGFSASLLQGLGGDTEAAAEIANMAIIDMADNANTYGTDMEAIQNAYMGFAKGNYTMLDNLKLGYGGTGEEMLRLINDSGILEQQIESLDDVTFDQMIEAIHAVQENLNVAGTTANEASSTISGSLNMLSASWQNLVTGMADSNADLGSLIDNVVSSATQVVTNLRPAISQALRGIGTLVEEITPIINDELPGILNSTLPVMISAITSLINTVADTLPDLIEALLPPILGAAIKVANSLANMLPSIINVISSQIPVVIEQLVPAVLKVLPQLIEAGSQMILAIGQGLADNADLILDSVSQLVDFIVNDFLSIDNIEGFISVATEIILTISQALIEHAPELVVAAVTLISNIVVALAESLPDIAEQVGNFIADLGEDLGEWLYDMFGDGLIKVGEGLADWFDKVGEFGADVLEKAAEIGADVIESIVTFFTDAWDNFTTGFSDLISKVEGFGDDIWEKFTGIFEDAKQIVSDAIEKIKGFFDFEWSLPDLKLPHFSMTGEFSLDPPSVPSIGVEWYAKAYNQPYILNDATIFGMAGGKALAGGEHGSEIVMGYNQLLDAISQATNQTIVIPVYIGGEQIDEFVVQSNQRNDFVSGGRG